MLNFFYIIKKRWLYAQLFLYNKKTLACRTQLYIKKFKITTN
jgi:hypothetical protein